MLTDWVGRLVGWACWNVLIVAPPKRRQVREEEKISKVLQMRHRDQLLYIIYVFLISSHLCIRKFFRCERDMW